MGVQLFLWLVYQDVLHNSTFVCIIHFTWKQNCLNRIEYAWRQKGPLQPFFLFYVSRTVFLYYLNCAFRRVKLSGDSVTSQLGWRKVRRRGLDLGVAKLKQCLFLNQLKLLSSQFLKSVSRRQNTFIPGSLWFIQSMFLRNSSLSGISFIVSLLNQILLNLKATG